MHYYVIFVCPPLIAPAEIIAGVQDGVDYVNSLKLQCSQLFKQVSKYRVILLTVSCVKCFRQEW